MKLTFKKKEKLKSRKRIDELFSTGQSLKKFPLVLYWKELEDIQGTNHSIQTGFSVPKRNFKKAVDRNLLKRRMREAFRLTKSQWYQSIDPGRRFIFMWMFIGKEKADYAQIEKSMNKLLVLWKSAIN